MQLAVDVTLCRVLSAEGEAHPNAAECDGVVLQHARRDKEITYPELVASRRCKLVVLAIETGGTLERSPVIHAFFLVCDVGTQVEPHDGCHVRNFFCRPRWNQRAASRGATQEVTHRSSRICLRAIPGSFATQK